MLIFQQQLSKKKRLDENLKKQFLNKYKFSNHNVNKFILLLRKGVYTYEYMTNQENFYEMLLPKKDDFSSHLKMEAITDADYTHAKRA